MSIDFAQIKNALRNVNDLRYTTDAMKRGSVDCYRSRVPFLNLIDVCETSWLLSACSRPIENWRDFNYTETRDNYAVYIEGLCTDRSTTMTNDYVQQILNSNRYNAGYGIQFKFVNVTNRAQYPVITNYLANTHEYEIVQRISTRRGDKPVDLIIARTTRRINGTCNIVRYVCFTTLWDYDLNKSILFSMANHLLTTPFNEAEFNRTAANRLAYTWFTKYFENQNILPSILEYIQSELASKIDEINKQRLLTNLSDFSKLKAAIRDNTRNIIQDEHAKIAAYERHIAECYSRIRNATLNKLKQEHESSALDVLNNIFTGMLNKGILSGFAYRTREGMVTKVTWRVRLPITYWEEDEAKYWLRELESTPYRQHLFKAMFIDRLIVPYFEQTITMDLESASVSNNAMDIDTSNSIYPPHPHVGIYNCFGNNATSAYDAILRKEFVTAVTICMNAVMQLNMTDHTVVSRFIRMCLPTEDYQNMSFLQYRGRMYTPIELKNIYDNEGGFHDGETNQTIEETTESNG